MMAFDRDRRVIFWSAGAERLFGWRASEVLGRPFPASVMVDSEVESSCAEIERTLNVGVIAGERVHRRTRDGRTLTLEVYAAAMRDRDGNPIGYAGQLIDVTEREDSRAEIERLAAAMSQTVDGVVIADRDGIIVYVNPAYGRQSGYSPEELVGRHHTAFVGEVVSITVQEDMKDAGRRGVPWFGEVEHRRRDGTGSLVQLSVTPVRDSEGVITSFVAVQRDVTELRAMEAGLALDSAVRRVLGEALHGLPADASLEEAAQLICDALTTLPGVDFTAVGAFLSDDDAVLLASRAPNDFPIRVGDHLPTHRASKLWNLARGGPWAERWKSTAQDGRWGEQLDAAGLKAFAFGPIVHGGRVRGGVVIGTRDETLARRLVDGIATVFDFSTTPSALLGERLHRHLTWVELWNDVTDLLDHHSFYPAFQPIVELATGEVVGYEALTRFASRNPPNLIFADAKRIGLGAELELATLNAAIEGARALPSGRFLNLNVSPSLLSEPAVLRERLAAADRPIVLEITEHDAVADYPALRAAVWSLGPNIRVAVDDAGAGIANFSHIVELSADFVKLDISLVRGVNTSLGRQALVVAMRHFAKTAGCRLIAEGVETEEEARTLTELGVEFAQGYLFGRPEPVSATP